MICLFQHHDVEVELIENDDCTLLSRATAIGSENIVRMLLGQLDVEVKVEEKDGSMTLAWATLVQRGQSAVMQVSVERDELEIE